MKETRKFNLKIHPEILARATSEQGLTESRAIVNMILSRSDEDAVANMQETENFIYAALERRGWKPDPVSFEVELVCLWESSKKELVKTERGRALLASAGLQAVSWVQPPESSRGLS